MIGWLKIKSGAEYSGFCVRTFRPWLKQGLRHVRLQSGTILVKREWIDQFLLGYEHGHDRVDNVVSEVMAGLIK